MRRFLLCWSMFFCPFDGKIWESCLIAIHAVTPRSNLSKTPQISKSFGFRPLCSKAGHLDISAQPGSLPVVHPAHRSRRDALASLRLASQFILLRRSPPPPSTIHHRQAIRLSLLESDRSPLSSPPSISSTRTALHSWRRRLHALPLGISTTIRLRKVAHIRQSRPLDSRRRFVCSAVGASTWHANPPRRINGGVGEVCAVWPRSRGTIVALLWWNILWWNCRSVCQRGTQRLTHNRRRLSWVYALRSADGRTFGVWVESGRCVCSSLAF